MKSTAAFLFATFLLVPNAKAERFEKAHRAGWKPLWNAPSDTFEIQSKTTSRGTRFRYQRQYTMDRRRGSIIPITAALTLGTSKKPSLFVMWGDKKSRVSPGVRLIQPVNGRLNYLEYSGPRAGHRSSAAEIQAFNQQKPDHVIKSPRGNGETIHILAPTRKGEVPKVFYRFLAPGSRTFHVAELTPAPRGYSIKPGALDTSGLW